MDCPTGLLISLDDNVSTQSQNDINDPEVSLTNPDNEIPAPQSATNTASPSGKELKLCGYLTKISTSGLMKLPKTRWFFYNPECCELFYSRNPNQDVSNSSLSGRIPLRRASFTFTATGLQENMFSITANGTTHTLQAQDRRTLLWWIKELQNRRRDFNIGESEPLSTKPDWHGTVLGSSVFWVPSADNEQGLIDIVLPEQKAATPNKYLSGDFPTFEGPPETVGDQAAFLDRPRSGSLFSGNGFSTLSNKLPKPNLEHMNVAFANAGEAAKKTLKSQAHKLMQGASRLDDLVTVKPTDDGLRDMGYSAFIKGLRGEIVEMQDELNLMKLKLQSKEESIQVLKMELERHEQPNNNASTHAALSNEERKLRSELISLKLTKERLQQEAEEAAARERALGEQNSMLQEMLSIKDDVVMQLSNQVHELEKSMQSLNEDHAKLKTEKHEEFVIVSPSASDENLSRLKDQAEGYLMQNKLLNHEILELATLRQVDAEKLEAYGDGLRLKEAQYCQLNSKYLVLLAEMSKPRSTEVGLAVAAKASDASELDRKDMVKILMQEALADTGETAFASTRKESKYDEFGFSRLPEDNAESSLLASASHMEKRASDLLPSLNDYRASVCAKWKSYAAANKDLQRGEDLKLLIRYGVPHQLRPKVWSWMVKNRTQQIRKSIDTESSYYRQISERKVAPLAAKQIELDLLRTLPNNRHFSSLASTGIEQLRRILLAYSIHNPSIGYCQGLNRIAAVALLYLREEEAFWCLVAVVEDIMPPDYYSHTLTASQADQRVFRELMAEKLPRLHRHFDQLQVDCSLITFNWLLCIFCDNVPPATMLHIWDVFLNEGSKVLFRYGLAFFRSVEDEILQLSDYMSVFAFLRVMSHRMHDVRSLTQIAFQAMNPFPMRRINRLRTLHLEKVNAELRELDIVRKGFVSQRRPQQPERDSDED